MSIPAVRTLVADRSLHAYIQRHPALNGPDEAMNRSALNAIRKGTCVCVSDAPADIERRPTAALMLDTNGLNHAERLLRAGGLSERDVRFARFDYGWRFFAVPPDARSVLCLGSGAGEELAFLRARAPSARIVVIDYVRKVRPGLLAAVDAEFIEGDLLNELASQSTGFDVVFSNHTLEHMFDPDHVLSQIFTRLRPGGLLVSGLPLDGDPTTPHGQAVLAMARAGADIHPLDVAVFDAGHPWKTNAADLRATLLRAGFEQVTVWQRLERPFRSVGPDAWVASIPRRVLMTLYAVVFAPCRAGLKRIYPSAPPLVLRRIVTAVERRVPFGASRLKNSFSPDVVLSAVRR